MRFKSKLVGSATPWFSSKTNLSYPTDKVARTSFVSHLPSSATNIFNKFVNNKYKLVPFNNVNNAVGKTKYSPAISKEWKNSVYYFNNNNMKNLPSYDINVNSLLKNYFNLFFKRTVLRNKKRISRRSRCMSFNKIFLSSAEIKHTSSKAIVTIYTYNRERIALIQKIKKLKINFFRRIWFFLIFQPFHLAERSCHSMGLKKGGNLGLFLSADPAKGWSSGLEAATKIYPKIYNVYRKCLKYFLSRQLLLIRRYKLRLSLNKYKFQERFLLKLSKILSKIYKKKVEFNIINLKSIILNSDIFTNIATLKIKKKQVNPVILMNRLLSKVKFVKIDGKLEKIRNIKSIDFNLLENKYKNLNLNSILIKDGVTPLAGAISSFDSILNKHYYKNIAMTSHSDSFSCNSTEDDKKLYDIVFNKIKHKNIGGVRLEVKGRLTKRYRADRAVYKVRWKGGLKNIDSSYKGLSSVNLRGYNNSNLEYSMCTSKRRIGAFAVKGWINGR